MNYYYTDPMANLTTSGVFSFLKNNDPISCEKFQSLQNQHVSKSIQKIQTQWLLAILRVTNQGDCLHMYA